MIKIKFYATKNFWIYFVINSFKCLWLLLIRTHFQQFMTQNISFQRNQILKKCTKKNFTVVLQKYIFWWKSLQTNWRCCSGQSISPNYRQMVFCSKIKLPITNKFGNEVSILHRICRWFIRSHTKQHRFNQLLLWNDTLTFKLVNLLLTKNYRFSTLK